MANMSTPIDFNSLKRLVFDVTGLKAISIDQVHRDEIRRNFRIVLEGNSVVTCSLLASHVPPYLMKSEVATMRYIRDHTNIPVPRVLAYNADDTYPCGYYVIVEQIPGVALDLVLPRLSPGAQDRIIAQIARWSSKLFQHRFNAIGSLYANTENGYIVGPIVSRQFFTEGRAQLHLNRGPYATAKDYLLSCTQREIDYARTLLTQDASVGYQRDLENCRLQVDQSMLLLADLIQKCQGIDEGDPELAPFSFDFHEMALKNFVVSEADPTQIVAVTGWDCIATKPLWQCGRLPRWLQSSMSDGGDDMKVRLTAIFRHVVTNDEGRGSILLRALDNEDSIRCSLHDLCNFDAFKDGFLLRPTLESIAATLPGDEDIEGLQAILDPSTVTGRVARISLMTTGSAGDALALAFSDLSVNDSKARGRTDFLDPPEMASIFLSRDRNELHVIVDLQSFVTCSQAFLAYTLPGAVDVVAAIHSYYSIALNMAPPPQIAQWIRQTYPKPRTDDDWLDACCAWIADQLHLNFITQTQDFISNVETKLLGSNLCDSMVGNTGFPLNVMSMNNERIRGPPILVEITAITEIGHSAFNLHNVRQTRIERADLAGIALDEDGENDEGPVPNYPRTMLRLELCDGTVTVPAIEYKKIPELKLGETPLGFKILLKDVLIRRGILFLEPQNIELKGHRTEDRDEHQDRDFLHGLYRRLAKPIPPDEEQNENDFPRDDPPPPDPPANTRAVQAVPPTLTQVRSPLREISEPPEPRPDSIDLDDDVADMPRKRRVPNPSNSASILSSSAATAPTLVASRFFTGSERPPIASTAGNVTQVLSRVLSPVRGAPIDIDAEISEPEHEQTPRVYRTGIASGKQKQQVPPQKNANTASSSHATANGPATHGSFEEFDFGSDNDIDEAFLAEIEKVEKAALEKIQEQSRASTSATRPSQNPAQAQSHAPSQPQSRSQRLQEQIQPKLRIFNHDVITIEDDEEDDKENVPVPKRRVRQRISATFADEVIDLSD